MRILILDDEDSIRHMLSVLLKKAGYDVMLCSDGASAVKTLEKEDFDFVLSDIKMPGMDGLEFLKAAKTLDQPPTVIMMSAYGTLDTAIECMRLGAYDYVSKPFKTDEVILTIKKAEERERLKRENARLREDASREYSEIYSKDQSMDAVKELVRKVADYDTTVLITGETGTGKELIARSIHAAGKRAKGGFVAVNCGAIPEKLLESELFGHVKGAFTDAVRNKTGLFQEANGGTLFLDEIGELPKELQVKLLRVLQEGEVRRVGDTKTVKVDARVVAATVKNLEEEIKTGGFREDLYYRLNVIRISVPPLRERRGDIAGLAAIFAERFAAKYSKRIKGFSKEALEAITGYSWPGNVRELENITERAVILEDSELIRALNVPVCTGGAVKTAGGGFSFETLSIKKAEELIEKELIKKALDATGGNRTKAAELLEISHRALIYKIKSYGIND